MKKYLFASSLILALSFGVWLYPAQASPTVVDSYSESNRVADFVPVFSTSYQKVGQTFKTTGAIPVSSAKFMLLKGGIPSGNMVVEIYAMAGTLGSTGFPTGSALATSDPINSTTLDTTPTLKTFNFSGVNNITLAANTNYALVLNSSSVTGDGGNYVGVSYDNTAPSHQGNLFYYAGGYVAMSTVDFVFYVYGEPIVTRSGTQMMMTNF